MDKLTSESSSSCSVIWGFGAVGRAGVSAGDPTIAAAEAPPASDKETPTAPNTGKASFRLFRFETRLLCGIVASSVPLTNPLTLFTLRVKNEQGRRLLRRTRSSHNYAFN